VKAIVVDADPQWPMRAEQVISQLRPALGPAARRVDHIGSTAVPGMPAKDVIDLQVSVASLADAGAFDEPLTALGFTATDITGDHVPAGMDDDPARWAKRFWFRRDHPLGAANLHVRAVGSPNERLALLFRDWFRAHPGAVTAYGQFKRKLAEAMSDVDAYSDIKDPVVDLVIWVAEGWAAGAGWSTVD
jgi:dephospho-CoA kinase